MTCRATRPMQLFQMFAHRKVARAKRISQQIAPWVKVDARPGLFSLEDADALLEASRIGSSVA